MLELSTDLDGKISQIKLDRTYAVSAQTVDARPEVFVNASQAVSLAPVETSTGVGSIILATANASGIYPVSGLYEVGPENVVFSPPLLLTFRYSTSTLAEFNIAESDIYLYHYEPDGSLARVLGQTRDTDRKEISVEISILTSIFAIFGESADRTAPVTTFKVVGPKHDTAEKTYISTRSSITLAAYDPVVYATFTGVAFTEYRIDAATDTAPFSAYSTPFVLPGGAHTVEFRSQDNVGNLEIAKSSAVFADGEPPVAEFSLAGTSFTVGETLYSMPGSTMTLVSSDAVSGVKALYYEINGATYTAPSGHAEILLPVGGDYLFRYYAADNVNNTGEEKSVTVRVDTTPPTTSLALAGTSGRNGWYISSMNAGFSVVDDRSGVKQTFYSLDGSAFAVYASSFAVSAEGMHTIEAYSIDNADNIESTKTFTFKIDVSTPIVGYTFEPAANAYGWNNIPVAGVFTGTDAVSGIEYCSSSFTITNEGLNIPVSGYCTDYAGWSSTVSFTVNIDTTAPVVEHERVPAANNAGWNNSDVTATFTCTDTLSGVKSCPADALLTSEGVNVSTTAKAYDYADNFVTTSVSGINIDKTAPVITISSPAAGETFIAARNRITAGFGVADNLDPAPAFEAFLMEIEDKGSPRGNRPSKIPVTNGQAIEPLEIDDGLWRLTVSATDFADNTAYLAGGIFEVIHDVLTPVTELTVSGPLYEGGGNTYIRKDTELKLESLDDLVQAGDGIGLGVKEQSIKVRDHLSDVRELTFVNPGPKQGEAFASTFTFASWGLADGIYYLDYNAEDVLDNVEAVKTNTVALDNTPPETAAELGGTAGDNGWHVSPVTVTLVSTDALSGVAGRYYRTEINGPLSEIRNYAEPVVINEEGGHKVYFYAMDNLGNTETEKSVALKIDLGKPVVAYMPDPAPNAAGWNSSAVWVAFSGEDAGSGVEECSSGNISTEGAGQELAGWCRDIAGNIGYTTATVNVDLTLPLVSAAQTPAPNAAGWNNTPVLAAFAGTDAVSGIAVCTSDITISVETSSRIVRGHCTDYAGWSSSAAMTISIDTTAPSLAYSRTPSNAAGWNNTDVAVNFVCNDNLSGVKRCPDSIALTVEARGMTVSGEAEDQAGNLAAVTVSNINIDKSAPDLTITDPTAGARYTNGIDMVGIHFSVADGLSGVRGAEAYLLRTEDKGMPGDASPGVIAVTNGQTLDPSDMDDGIWRLTISATDFADNAAYLAGGTFEVIHDTVPPVTELTVGEPKFISGGVTFINSGTPLSFNTTDDLLISGDGAGTGIAATYVSVNGGPFTAVTGPVFISSEGAQSVAYYSVDKAGNREADKTAAFIVDAAAPLISLNFPAPGAVGLERALAGVIAVKGSISDIILSSWTLEYAAGADAQSGYVFITSGSIASSGMLAAWNTAGLAGDCTLRLSAADSVGNAAAVRSNVFIGAPVMTAAIGRWESLKVDFKHPRGLAVTSDGLIWVSDTDNNRVLQLTGEGNVLAELGGKRKWRRHGKEGGRGGWENDDDAEFLKPQGLAVDAAGYLYVADTNNHRVLKLSATGQILLEIGKRTGRWDHPGPGRKPGEFIRPTDVAVSGAGLIYVADRNNGRIQIFGPAGDFIKAFATGIGTDGRHEGENERDGDEPDEDEGRECGWGEFSDNSSRPYGLALDTPGNIWVSDTSRKRLLQFTGEGELLQTITAGTTGLKRPGGVVTDSKDAVYAADLGGGGIFKFAYQGEPLLNFGGRADGKWWKRMFAPSALDFSPEKDLWVADTFHNRIIRYSITPSSFTPGFTPFDDEIVRGRGKWGEVVKKGIASRKGGKLRHDKGAEVELPAGALHTDADVSIEEIEPPGRSGAGRAARGAAYEFGPDKTVFKTPVTISLPYDSYDPAKESLSVAYWNAEAENWEPLESEVDQNEKTVKAKTGHFSVYQVMASSAAGAVIGMRASDSGAPSAGLLAVSGADPAFRLGEVYVFPNPSKGAQVPTLHIETGIADSVNIKIYTVSGRQAHEHTLAGLPAEVDDGNGLSYAYEYAWRDHIPSGVYYYSIEAKKGGQKLKKAGKFAIVR